MRISTIAGAFAGGVLMLGLAAPAAAQGAKVDFAVGYQYIVDLPIGWAAAVGVGKDWVKLVGEVAGNYVDDYRLHTFQGGVEFSGTGMRVVPFGRLLSGVAVSNEVTGAVFVLTPEGGVKIKANDRVGIQASVGFPYFRTHNDSSYSFRFFTGVVIRK